MLSHSITKPFKAQTTLCPSRAVHFFSFSFQFLCVSLHHLCFPFLYSSALFQRQSGHSYSLPHRSKSFPPPFPALLYHAVARRFISFAIRAIHFLCHPSSAVPQLLRATPLLNIAIPGHRFALLFRYCSPLRFSMTILFLCFPEHFHAATLQRLSSALLICSSAHHVKAIPRPY